MPSVLPLFPNHINIRCSRPPRFPLSIVDYVCLGVFTAELLLRLATCPSLRAFALDPMNWVDVAAVLPFYIELMVVGPGGSGEGARGLVLCGHTPSRY